MFRLYFDKGNVSFMLNCYEVELRKAMAFGKKDLKTTLLEYPNTFVVVGAHSLEDYWEFDCPSNFPNFFLLECDSNRVELMSDEAKDLNRIKVFSACISDESNADVAFYELPLGSSSILAPITESLMTLSSEFEKPYRKRHLRSMTLDDWSRSESFSDPICLIVDVQGAEGKVLKGSRAFLERVGVILIEVSTRKFYENQVLFKELKRELERNKFRIVRKRIDPWISQGDIVAIKLKSGKYLHLRSSRIRMKIEDLMWIWQQTTFKKVLKRFRYRRTLSV